MTKFSKISQFCVFGITLLAASCGGSKSKSASESSSSANKSAPPSLAEGKPLENISPYLKVQLLTDELRKYCYFIDASMIRDPLEKPEKRQYTKPAHLEDKPHRDQLMRAHIKLHQLLCNGPKNFVGFATSTNASEKIVIDILTMRHIWALIDSQDHTPNIKKVGNAFKGSYYAWEKAFGNPETRLWKDFFSKHSSMSEADYQQRVQNLSKWSRRQVLSRFQSFL